MQKDETRTSGNGILSFPTYLVFCIIPYNERHDLLTNAIDF